MAKSNFSKKWNRAVGWVRDKVSRIIVSVKRNERLWMSIIALAQGRAKWKHCATVFGLPIYDKNHQKLKAKT